MLTPAIIPVTAGKKTAKTTQNPGDSGAGSVELITSVVSMALPNIKETIEITIPTIITYCAFMAALAEPKAMAATIIVVMIPNNFSSS